jgi:hypothetical protein
LKQNIDNEWKEQQQKAVAAQKGSAGAAVPPSTDSYRPVNTYEAAIVIAADNSLGDDELGGGAEMEALSATLKSVEEPTKA